MLSTELLALFAFNCLFLGYVLWKIARLKQFLRTNNKRALSLARIAEVEATLTDLSDAYASLLRSHKKLRARIGMREARAKKAENGGDLPDSRVDPDAWKRAMRLRLKESGVL